MSRINHSRHVHRGRQIEYALSYQSIYKMKQGKAKAANEGRSLTAEELAAEAARMGVGLVSRAA